MVVPEGEADDLRYTSEQQSYPELGDNTLANKSINRDLALVAFKFGQYLSKITNKIAIASEICKHVYQQVPKARDILNAHDKLRGLIKKVPISVYADAGSCSMWHISCKVGCRAFQCYKINRALQ